MESVFKEETKVKVVHGPQEYLGRIGEIVKNGDSCTLTYGFQANYEGVKNKLNGRRIWIVLIDENHDAIAVPESALELL